MFTIIRIPRVKSKIGYTSNSSVYAHVADETLVPPIKIGPRASGWVEQEVDIIIAARIAGMTDAEIRDLVRKLVAQRKKLIPSEVVG